MTAEHASEPLRYDVVVVGAGPAGAACAIALRRRALSVALIERHWCGDPSAAADEGTARATWPAMGESISASAQFPLRELGLWEAFLREGHRPSYLTQSLWGSDELRERHAISHPLGPDIHVDRERFDAWLRRAAVGLGADLFCGTMLDRARWQPNQARFSLTCSRRSRSAETDQRERPASLTLEANYVIDATGRSAGLSRKLGGRQRAIDDLVCVGRWYEQVEFEPSILVETTSTGWWYSAPLPQQRALALHLTLAKGAAQAREHDSWQQLLDDTTMTARRLASAVPTGPARVCAATPALGEWSSELPFLPVGDAAAAFDPISGSGLCFAFRSALEAASVLSEARAGRRAPFSGYQQGVRNVLNEHLRRRSELYARERRWPEAPFWTRMHQQSRTLTP